MTFVYNLAFLLVIISSQVYGQSLDTTRLATSVYPTSLYKNATMLSQNLYNGRIYYMYDAREEESQFYVDRKPFLGNISVENQTYDNIPILYDLFKDEVIVRHFDGDFIIIPSAKVKGFSIYGHHFKKLKQGVDINANMETGIYDIVYDGVSKTLIRRIKQRQDKIVDRKVIVEYYIKDKYFIRRGDQYYPVHTKKSVFNLLPEHKRELRKAARSFENGFRKNREEAIIKMVNIHDQLSKK